MIMDAVLQAQDIRQNAITFANTTLSISQSFTKIVERQHIIGILTGTIICRPVTVQFNVLPQMVVTVSMMLMILI